MITLSKETADILTVIRAHKMQHFGNAGKVNKIKDVLPIYHKTAEKLMGKQWRLFYETGSFDKNAKILDVDVYISERYKQTCQYQVVGMCNSHISNKKNRFREIIRGSTLDDGTKKQLYYINKHGLWYNKEVKIPKYVDNKRVKGEHDIVSQEIIKLSRQIFKGMKWKRPSTKNINLMLDAKVVQIKPKVEQVKSGKKYIDGATEFDYWLNVSTLESGHPVMIPIKKNKYFDSIDGQLCNSCQFNFDKDNNLSIYFMKNIPVQKYTINVKEIGVDVGLNTLIATTEGDLFGRQLYDKLKYWDYILTDIMKEQQRLEKKKYQKSNGKGIRIATKHYNRVVKIVKEMIKNEINRIVNRIIELYHPGKIVVEKLDFRNSNLSRQINRILNNFGKGILTKKLESIKELYGIEIEEVNPAYTSQECTECGYVDKRNRKGDEFKCLWCGHTGHADIDGSETILVRSSDKEITVYSSVKQVFGILARRFVSRVLNDSKNKDAVIVRLSRTLSGNKYMPVYEKHIQCILEESKKNIEHCLT